MSLASLLGRPCTIVQRSDSGATDPYGNDVATEALLETVCEIQQQRRDEPGDQGEVSDARWLGILPAGTELGTGDGVLVDDMLFECVGAPWPVRNPRTGQESHVEASLRRVAAAESGS